MVDTGSDIMGFAAGALAGMVMAAIFGGLVIWLNTNQYATGLALTLFGTGFSAFAGISYVQEKMPDRISFAIPYLMISRWLAPRCFANHHRLFTSR